MKPSHTIYEWEVVNANAAAVYDFISSEKFLKLTGADEIEIDFREGGNYRLLFHGRGEIFGTIEEIIPYHRIILVWNVKGFDRPDEANNRVKVLLDTTKGTTVSVEHSGIENEEAAEAKKKAWREILDDLKDLLQN